MKLFEIIFYSIDGGEYKGYFAPETSWIVEANDLEEVMNRCDELNKRFRGGMFSARVVSSIKLDDLTIDKVIEKLEYL